MATTAPPLSVEEYLKTKFEGPDPEYLDGELVGRGESMTMHPHSFAALRLGSALDRMRKTQRLYAGTEMHLRLGDNRIRIADVAAFHPDRPSELIPSAPPFLVCEVVSRDDALVDIVSKLEEYRAWGVRHVWLVDPWLRAFYVYDGKLRQVDSLTVDEPPIQIEPSDIFD